MNQRAFPGAGGDSTEPYVNISVDNFDQQLK